MGWRAAGRQRFQRAGQAREAAAHLHVELLDILFDRRIESLLHTSIGRWLGSGGGGGGGGGGRAGRAACYWAVPLPIMAPHRQAMDRSLGAEARARRRSNCKLQGSPGKCAWRLQTSPAERRRTCCITQPQWARSSCARSSKGSLSEMEPTLTGQPTAAKPATKHDSAGGLRGQPAAAAAAALLCNAEQEAPCERANRSSAAQQRAWSSPWGAWEGVPTTAARPTTAPEAGDGWEVPGVPRHAQPMPSLPAAHPALARAVFIH